MSSEKYMYNIYVLYATFTIYTFSKIYLKNYNILCLVRTKVKCNHLIAWHSFWCYNRCRTIQQYGGVLPLFSTVEREGGVEGGGWKVYRRYKSSPLTFTSKMTAFPLWFPIPALFQTHVYSWSNMSEYYIAKIHVNSEHEEGCTINPLMSYRMLQML